MISQLVFISLCLLSTVLMLAVLWRLNRALALLRSSKSDHTSDDLPTVSVCIPARNETHAMTRCLEAVLASDYKKLEVLVLDDNSVDDTSILIKSFAHAGVRFVVGESLPPGWLGKNHAFNQLSREASGSLLLFLDVDSFIAPSTIRKAVQCLLSSQAAVLSVIPKRLDNWRMSSLFGTLRHFWLILRHSKKQPIASSAFWMVETSAIQSVSDLSAFRRLVQPEIAIVRALRAKNLVIETVLADKQLAVSYEKHWLSQKENAIRLLKPSFGGLARVSFAFALLVVTLLPFAYVVWAIIGLPDLYWLGALVPIALGYVVAYRYYAAVWGFNIWVGVALWPYIVVQESYFLILSTIGYARRDVTWKGRRISVD